MWGLGVSVSAAANGLMLARLQGGEALAMLVCLFVFVTVAIIFGHNHQQKRMAEAQQHLKQARAEASLGNSREALEAARRAVAAFPNSKKSSPQEVEARAYCVVLEGRLADESRATKSAVPTPEPASQQSKPAPLTPGLRLGEYVLEEPIGEGGFGQVWKAHHAAFGTAAAVKIPNQPRHRDSLRRLGKIQFQLDNPHIVKVLGAELDGDTPYVALEYVAGQDLRRLLETETRLPCGRALGLFQQVLLGMQAAHQAGIVHCDLKPENILVSPDDQVKVTDFELGRARLEAERPLLLSGGLASQVGFGTAAYMAPEQLGGEPVDHRTDIYALGVILFEMLTGERPHPGDKPSELQPDVPAELDEVFARCFARVEKRFNSVEEMLASLSEV